MLTDLPFISSKQIVAQRPPKNKVQADRPYGWIIEQECGVDRTLNQVITLFLTGRECVFNCVMCDLWKNTLDYSTPIGALPQQITWALQDLEVNWQKPLARNISAIKLYNSGNFFDKKAVPINDWPEIAKLVSNFQTVIVENHPAFCNDHVFQFQELISGQLEVAIGLETTHPLILPWLNKRMTLRQYEKAVKKLIARNIRIRTFILVKPPFLNEYEGIEWAIRSMEFAFNCGVECCSLVPVRAGNGIMDELEQSSFFKAPDITSLEIVIEAGLEMKKGRIFMDLWNSQIFKGCEGCKPMRLQRISAMNKYQSLQPEVQCGVCN